MDFNQLKDILKEQSLSALSDGLYSGVIASAKLEKSSNDKYGIKYKIDTFSKDGVGIKNFTTTKWNTLEASSQKAVEISLQQLAILSKKAHFDIDSVNFEDLNFLTGLEVSFNVKSGEVKSLF